jgi:hypothetical protein
MKRLPIVAALALVPVFAFAIVPIAAQGQFKTPASAPRSSSSGDAADPNQAPPIIKGEEQEIVEMDQWTARHSLRVTRGDPVPESHDITDLSLRRIICPHKFRSRLRSTLRV